MYTEWKFENSELRPLLLYFLELYILSFGKETYFNKGNITSAKKIKAFCEEGEIDMMKYVLIGFLKHKDAIQKFGFRYLNSKRCQLSVVNELLAEDYQEYYLAKGTKAPTLFDKLRVELERARLLTEASLNEVSVQTLLEKVIQSELSYEALIYLSMIDNDFYTKVKPILKALKARDKKGFVLAEKKVSFCMKRGILPKLLSHMAHNKTCYEWAVTGDPEKNETNKSKAQA